MFKNLQIPVSTMASYEQPTPTDIAKNDAKNVLDLLREIDQTRYSLLNSRRQIKSLSFLHSIPKPDQAMMDKWLAKEHQEKLENLRKKLRQEIAHQPKSLSPLQVMSLAPHRSSLDHVKLGQLIPLHSV